MQRVERWLNRVRLRVIWLAAPLYLFLARPSVGLILAGALLASCGALVRAWAAGTIHKNRTLTTTGPYAHSRNPLYLGTLLIGAGAAVAAGQPAFVLGVVAFFLLVYGRMMAHEARQLEDLFGAAYREYARHVPLLLPRLTPYRPGAGQPPPRFTLRRYINHREYEAALGTVLLFLALVVKLVLE